MNRALRLWILVSLFLVLGGVAVWQWSRPATSPSFGLGARRITPITQPSLTVGKDFAGMVAPDGTLWAWGDPSRGGPDLGIPPGWIPQQISKEKDWKQVTAGFFGLLALKQDGSLWGLGSDSEGLLGSQSTNQVLTRLARIGVESDWKEIKAGVAHCMALKRDGSLWTWGQNNYGQIGIGKVTPKEPPTRVLTETNWLEISPGAFSSYALRGDGTIWAWGIDFITSTNITSPIQLPGTNWIQIAAGEYHLAAVASDRSCWIIGANAGLIAKEAKSPMTNWFQLQGMSDFVDLRSGENCLLGKRGDTWYPAGTIHTYGVTGPFFPQKLDPLLLHTQRATTLFLMPDGRLWSLGNRVGADPSKAVIERMRAFFASVLRRSSSAATTYNDPRPFLIWEQP